MANLARRSALKMLAAIPIAGPVAAKEAAAKMGMGSLLGTAGQIYKGETGYNKTELCRPATVAERIASYRDDIEKARSADRVKDLRRRYRSDARTLDPDLAALHSMQPQAAYHIQLDRLVEQDIANDVSMYQRWIDELLGSK